MITHFIRKFLLFFPLVFVAQVTSAIEHHIPLWTNPIEHKQKLSPKLFCFLKKWAKKANKCPFKIRPSEKPILMSRQAQVETPENLHEKGVRSYCQETLKELRFPKQNKVGWLDFKGKTREDIRQEVVVNVKQEFKNNGTPIEQATINDVEVFVKKSEQDPKVLEAKKQIEEKIKNKNIYKTTLDCAQQENSQACREKIKALMEAVTAKLYEEYYEADKGKVTALLNYKKKEIPLWIATGAICAFHPDNLRKIDQEQPDAA